MFTKVVILAACLFGLAQTGAALAGYGGLGSLGYGSGLGYARVGHVAGLGYGGVGGLGYAGAPATSYVHRVDYTGHGYGLGGYGAGYGAGYAGYGRGLYGHGGW